VLIVEFSPSRFGQGVKNGDRDRGLNHVVPSSARG
jgi:hypothetical protein